MKKWKNPFVTLRLDRFATQDEVRDRPDLFDGGQDDAVLSGAVMALTQNTDNIFRAFLTAPEGMTVLEEPMKAFKRYRKAPPLDDETLQDAFSQMGLPFEDKLTEEDVDGSGLLSDLPVGLEAHRSEIQAARKGGKSKQPAMESDAMPVSVEAAFDIPQLIH